MICVGQREDSGDTRNKARQSRASRGFRQAGVTRPVVGCRLEWNI